jgi:mono/diheme cytochrome c family protein
VAVAAALAGRKDLDVKALRFLWHALAVVGLLAIAGAVWFAGKGVTAKPVPGPLETRLSRAARHYLIPAAARARTSPQPATPETLREGLEHWADHCASCHGNDGAGQTAIGQGLYPKAPDMRLADTQSLSDGELFYIIEEGVKITGMPAWGTGTPEGEAASWHLVQFIRHLPTLSEDDLARMEELNPRGRADWQAYEEERKFLSGTLDVPAGAPPAPGHHH